MKFEEVLPALREGKKIRRTFWNPKHYIELKGIHIYDNDTCKDYNFNRYDFTCDNWEIYEEPLLRKDEKELIKGVLKFMKNRGIELIKIEYDELTRLYYLCFESEKNIVKCRFSFNDRELFNNLELNHYYTLKELELDD